MKMEFSSLSTKTYILANNWGIPGSQIKCAPCDQEFYPDNHRVNLGKLLSRSWQTAESALAEKPSNRILF